VVVGKSGADGLAHLEATIFCQKFDFRGRKGVVLRKFEHSMIKPFGEILFQTEQTKMEVE